MGSVAKRPDGRYRARYRDPEGKERARHFDRKVDADRWLISVEHSKLVGDYVDPSAGRVTMRAYAETWRARQVHRQLTAEGVESILKNHVYPHLGGRPLGSIRTADVQAWVKAVSEDLAPSTVELIYRYLKTIMRAAVEDRVIPRSPCTKSVKLPKKEGGRVVPLEVDQVLRMAEALPERYRALVTLGAGSGLRQGEAFGLTVDRVDFLRRTVTVDRQLISAVGKAPEFGPPKTTASYRTVPVAQLVTDALAAHLAEFGPGPDGLIFTNGRGEAIRRAQWSPIWRPAATTAALPTRAGFHALRHFYASALIAAGCSVKVVQEALGHAKAAQTLDTYSHLWPNDEDRARQAVEAIFAQPAQPGAQVADSTRTD